MAVLQIPVTKGKATIDFDTDWLSDEVYTIVVMEGLKTLLNRGTSKVTKETYPDEAELRAKAMEIAAAQVEKVKTGDIKKTGAAKSKESGKVMAEARRIARGYVKDLMKEAGIKISHVKASEITKAANDMIAGDPTIIEQAKANIEQAETAPKAKIDIKSLIKTDPELVAKAEAKAAKEKAERATQLSKTQAGKAKTRKPKGEGAGAQA